jgi:hypothetical protein
MKLQTMAVLMLGSLLPALGSAQEVEPGVQTSSAAAPAQPTAPPSPSTQVPANQAPVNQAPASPKAPAASAKPKAAVTPVAADKAAPPAGKSSDRIQLDTTQISGNQELPKVMYVVPWRRADPGDFSGRPPNSLLDEALTPVDRDVFKRQNRYYGALQGQSPASATDSAKDEK